MRGLLFWIPRPMALMFRPPDRFDRQIGASGKWEASGKLEQVGNRETKPRKFGVQLPARR
jgi:hypothetical protein